MTMACWTPRLHALLGGIVVAVGAFVMWEQASPAWTLIFAATAILFLWWKGRTVGMVWAWTTLGLGIESMTWPIVTMVQIRMGGNQPTEEQMGTILNAVLFGLFSSVFWVTFSFGLFKRAREGEAPSPPTPDSERVTVQKRKKRART